MKKYIRIMLVTLLSMGIISCKKSGTPPPKDYGQSINDKTWWGMLTYTGQTAEYYSVHFNSDKSLTWSQLAGDYPGQWAINGKQLTITFTGNNVKIQADISDDDKLVNITDNTSNSEINSGQVITSANIPLENTAWKGATTYLNNFSYLIQFNFLPGEKVVVSFGGNANNPYSYTRSASGAVIRTSVDAYRIFCIITSATEMKGNNKTYDVPFQATKQ